MASIFNAIKTEAERVIRLDALFNPENLPEQRARHEIIIERRGAFKWLPALCSNDLVHGSWWFVWGSVGGVLFAILPLIITENSPDFDDQLPTSAFDATWAILIICGIFFTIGSFMFVRAFEEPPVRPLLYNYKHFQTDELVAAWLFLAGTVPSVPYMLVYFVVSPSTGVLGALGCSFLGIFGCILFVVACYPAESHGKKNYAGPFLIRWLGERAWITKHLANDWLAGTWFFLVANIFLTIGSFGDLLLAAYDNDPKQEFLGGTSTITSTLFLVGSFYYVSGSYPYEGQFYYAKETSQTSNMKVRKRRATFSDERSAEDPVFNPLTDSVGYEVVGALKKERVQTLETVPEGQNEEMSPKSSSDNLVGVGQRPDRKSTPMPTLNPIQSPTRIQSPKISLQTPNNKLGSKIKSRDELGHDIDF